MDLSKSFPRGPRETLGGFAWLPRMIDKARAELAGTIGDYHYNCAMDSRLLRFLGLAPQGFLDIVRISADDASILQKVSAAAGPRSEAAITEFNAMMLSLSPTSPEMLKRFEESREKLAPGRKDVTTWAALIDLEEGRLK